MPKQTLKKTKLASSKPFFEEENKDRPQNAKCEFAGVSLC
jgi:hypothetical protein